MCLCYHRTRSAPSFISCACAVDLSNRDWKSAPPCSQASLIADFILSARTMNFDGRRSSLLRKVTTYVLASCQRSTTKKGGPSEATPLALFPFFRYFRARCVIENRPYLQHHEGGPKPCCSVSIRFSAITVCIVGHQFGHGWAVVMTSAREVKSASLEGLSTLTFYLSTNAFSTLITKTHHT